MLSVGKALLEWVTLINKPFRFHGEKVQKMEVKDLNLSSSIE